MDDDEYDDEDQQMQEFDDEDEDDYYDSEEETDETLERMAREHVRNKIQKEEYRRPNANEADNSRPYILYLDSMNCATEALM